MTPPEQPPRAPRRSRFAFALLAVIATFALAASACGTSKKTDEADSGQVGTRSTDVSIDVTGTAGVGGEPGSASTEGATDPAASGGAAGAAAGAAPGNPRSGRSTEGANPRSPRVPSAGGQVPDPNGQPSNPGSPYCAMANVVSTSLYDVTDPGTASSLRELQSVSPPELSDVFRYLLDINKQATDLDPQDAAQVAALDAVLRSKDFEDAGQAVDNYTYATCGFEMYL